MSLENVARLFVGIGFLWVAGVLLVAVLAGFDKPTTWLHLLGELMETEVAWYAHLALSLFVVPIGMLTFLRDILGDPVAVWVKWAAPGAFLALYAVFLTAALPDLGRPLLLAFDGITPVAGLGDAPDAVGIWLLRFATAFAVLAGGPGVLGALIGLGGGRRR